MLNYIMLFKFTDQGIRNIKEAPKRIQSAQKAAEEMGVNIKQKFGVLGQYDTLFILEAPNDETITRLALQISSIGNVHTETLRAFNEEEFLNIVNKIS